MQFTIDIQLSNKQDSQRIIWLFINLTQTRLTKLSLQTYLQVRSFLISSRLKKIQKPTKPSDNREVTVYRDKSWII